MKLSWKMVALGVIAALLAAAGGWGYSRYRQRDIRMVTAEAVDTRDLEEIVSASGKIEPKRSVEISADTMGRVTQLAFNEGQQVKVGDFLLQIDPRNLQSAVSRNEAGLAAARAQLSQARAAVESAGENLALARETLRRQRDLWAAELTTREALDRAETDVKLRESELRERELQVSTQERRIEQEAAILASAQYDLSKVRILSPIDGIVTRRNIEEGETVVIGTMNNPGTVLLTVADMSVIEAELEVDETDIPGLRIGQPAKVTIDALPDRTFTGIVTEIGNSPIQPSGAPMQVTDQAIDFKVVVTLDGQIEEVRPGFTCSADIVTATRERVTAVPIQAMVVREMEFDAAGALVRRPREEGRRGLEPVASARELPTGHTRRETEGVFVMRDGRAVFVPVETGIAGERHFEVLKGLESGDQVITGPLESVREIVDGDRVALKKEERTGFWW
jgi:HlyD family secretion protein